MHSAKILIILIVTFVCRGVLVAGPSKAVRRSDRDGMSQVPTWSRADLEFFLHGSMSTEVIPENVLRAFMRIYPDLYPKSDFTNFGLIPDASHQWPVGISRRNITHLGGLPSIGINCASCHVGDVVARAGAKPIRVLGMTSHFDVEAFFGSMLVATFRTPDPANMHRFLAEYLAVSGGGERAREQFERLWQQQETKITNVLSEDPYASKATAAGTLYAINGSDLQISSKTLADGMDLSRLVVSFTRLFHNMRAALHVPDQPPDPAQAPPPSGPGRNDAFGLLTAEFFGEILPYAPIKFGLVWNLKDRHWVHWDGNTQSPIGRNLLAVLGLGAPLINKHGYLEFEKVHRHTILSEAISSPRYPWSVDKKAAQRGGVHYKSRCASCHDGVESDRRLISVEEVGTHPLRARLFTQMQADRFNGFLSSLETPGYKVPSQPGMRSTQKYWAASLRGVWARSPYLHNGSVRTMEELLASPDARAKTFHRGSRFYDTKDMGYVDDGSYLLDTTKPGNSNSGHNYGTELSASQKHDLIEYLKTI